MWLSRSDWLVIVYRFSRLPAVTRSLIERGTQTLLRSYTHTLSRPKNSRKYSSISEKFEPKMPRKAMKVIVELDIHTVRSLWNFELGIFGKKLVANDAMRSVFLFEVGLLFLLNDRYSNLFLGDMSWNISTRLWICLLES